jgi:carboxylesterase
MGGMEHIRNPHLDGRPFFWEGGPTGVLLLHGLTATTAEVRLLAEQLRAAGYTVSAPLLPGHGTNPEELNAVRWRDWAWEAEMAYELLATTCDYVFVGGESTGGALALHLAARHPEIAGVLCYAPAVKLAIPPGAMAQLYAAAPLVDSIPKRKANTNPHWQGYIVYPLWAVVELVRLGREVRLNLHCVHQPVLVMQGRHDETIDPLCGQMILDGVQSAHKELYWLENSAHVIVLEDELPQIVALTLRFMDKVMQTTNDE